MRYTLLYFKIIILVALALVMLAGFICGGWAAITGLLGAIAELDVVYLIVLLAGLFLGFMGFVALDLIVYIYHNWSWTV